MSISYTKKNSLNNTSNRSNELGLKQKDNINTNLSVNNDENNTNVSAKKLENLSKEANNHKNIESIKSPTVLNSTNIGGEKQGTINKFDKGNTNDELYSEIKKKLKNQTQDYIIKKHNSSSINTNNVIQNAIQSSFSTNKNFESIQNTQVNSIPVNSLVSKTLATENNEKSLNIAIEKANLLYSQHKDNLQKRDQLYLKGKLIKEEKELEGCTFIPDTSMFKTQKVETGEVYERNLIWKTKKQVWLEQEKNNLTLKKENDCTFKPNINKVHITYPEMDEKQLNFTKKYKDRLIEAEKRKQEDRIRLLPNYEKLYEQTHNYNKNIEPYLEKMGINNNLNSNRNKLENKYSEIYNKNSSIKQSSNFNTSILFNNIDIDLVISTLRNEIKEANLDVDCL